MKLTEEQDKDKKQQEDDAKRRDNPFYDKKVILKYVIHCDDKAELVGSEVPAPVLASIMEQESNDVWNFRIFGKAIPKGFPITFVFYYILNISFSLLFVVVDLIYFIRQKMN